MVQPPGAQQPCRRWPALLAGPLVSLLVVLLPLDLPASAHALAALLACVVVYWVTEPIPLPMTALLGTAVAVLLGLGSAKTVFAAYGHPVIFLFIGSFLLAEAMAIHQVDRKVAEWILGLSWVRDSPARLLLALGMATAAISMWISNTAATAMMLPIGLGVLSSLQEAGHSDPAYRTGLMLMLSYAATAGGMATLVGTPPNLIGAGLIAEQAGITISFVTWLSFGLPLAVLMLLAAWLLLRRLHTDESIAALPAPPAGSREAWTTGQIHACIAFGVAVALWIVPDVVRAVSPQHSVAAWVEAHLPNELVALLAASLLFILPGDRARGTPVLTWPQAMKINWGIVLLFGGGLAFGDLMMKTGLSDSVGQGFVRLFGVTTVWSLTAIAIVAGVLLSELASNTAAANLIIPVVIAIAQADGVSPLPPALGACLGASLGFALPVSTPPNAMVYGTSLVPIASMIRAGLLFDLIGCIVIWITLRITCPLLGLA